MRKTVDSDSPVNRVISI